jgi:hypothetical protein
MENFSSNWIIKADIHRLKGQLAEAKDFDERTRLQVLIEAKIRQSGRGRRASDTIPVGDA